MSDYKAFKDKTIDQISKHNKINQELTKRINNYKFKQNQLNRKLSNCIDTVQTEFSDYIEKLKEQLDKLNNWRRIKRSIKIKEPNPCHNWVYALF